MLLFELGSDFIHIYEAFIKCYRVHGSKELSGREHILDTFLVSLDSTRVLFKCFLT